MESSGHTVRSIRHTLRLMLLAQYVFAGGVLLLVLWFVRSARVVPSASIITWWQMVFLGVFVFALFFTLLKKVKSRLFWESIFTLTVFLGVWFLLLFILPFGWALGIASTLTLLQVFFPYVIIHNLFYLIGCVGVAVNFAGWLAPDVLLFGLVLFSIYDTVAGAPGGAVEILASRLVTVGIIPGLVIPDRVKVLFTSLSDVSKGDSSLLGAGDVILPLTLVAKAAIHGVELGGIVLAGLVLSAAVLGRISDGHPRAALPILAAGAAVPFVILRAIGLV